MTQLGKEIAHVANAKWQEIITNYMDDARFQGFSLWAISPDNPHRDEYVECLAFNQIINLFNVVTDGLLKPDDTQQPVVDALALMTVQQIYEVCSDSLAIGLGKARVHWQADDYHRERLLRIFNRAMRERIVNPTSRATDLLSGYRTDYNKISLFEQSMTAHKQRRTVLSFAQYDNNLAHQLEYSTYETLITHIEATAEMRQVMEDYNTYPIFMDGLHRRYRGVNDTLLHLQTTSEERLAIGRDTMLIVPTLAYFIGVIYERAKPHAKTIHMAIEEGILTTLFDKAAILIRALNDIGTWFLEAPDHEVIALLDTLNLIKTDDNLLITAISKAAQDDARFSRLEKDIVFDEINILLDAVRYHDDPSIAMSEKVEHLKELICEMRRLYKLHCQTYQSARAQAESLPTSEFLIPIHRAVTFHRQLYGATFWNQTGEYNI